MDQPYFEHWYVVEDDSEEVMCDDEFLSCSRNVTSLNRVRDIPEDSLIHRLKHRYQKVNSNWTRVTESKGTVITNYEYSFQEERDRVLCYVGQDWCAPLQR